jgi:hypothetical protein
MNETCDRCGPAVRAAYRAVRGGQLYLCQHCTAQLSPALREAGPSGQQDTIRSADEPQLAQRTSRSVAAAAG